MGWCMGDVVVVGSAWALPGFVRLGFGVGGGLDGDGEELVGVVSSNPS